MKVRELKVASANLKNDVSCLVDRIKSKEDLILILQGKYECLKVALGLGFCTWREKCDGCSGLVSLVERPCSRNLWWRCRNRLCRRYFSTFEGSLFSKFERYSWKDIFIVIWETSYDGRTTSASIARVKLVVVLCL